MSKSIPESGQYDQLLAFLVELDKRKIHFELSHIRPDSVLVAVAVPGERWEIEYMQDGSVEVERFISTGTIEGRDRLNDLFARFSD